MKRQSDEKPKGSSIAAGLRKLAIATVVFGISYVLFFTFCWGGD